MGGISGAGSFLRPGPPLWHVLLISVGPVWGATALAGRSVQSGESFWKHHLMPSSSPSNDL